MSELSELDKIMIQENIFDTGQEEEELSELDMLMAQEGITGDAETLPTLPEEVKPVKEMSRLDLLLEQEGMAPSSKKGITVKKPDGSEGLHLIDQDTYQFPNGNIVRDTGLGAPEVSHLIEDDLTFTRGEIGGNTATLLGEKAVREEGFFNENTTGEKGFFGRDLGTSDNDRGQSYSKFMLHTGAGYLSKYANKDDVYTSVFGNLERARRRDEGKETEWDKLVEAHNDHVSQGKVSIKPFAINEQIYAAAPDLYAGVAIRRNDRTIMNETKPWQLGQAFSMGWDHGIIGATTAVGMIEETFKVDSIDNWGYAHAESVKKEVEEAPWMRDMQAFDKNGDWTLDGVSEFTNYAFSNLLTSLPVMSVGIAAVVAMPATMGLSLLAPAAIYSGSNYDEQNKKDMADAIVGGIFMTSLDVLGVKLGGAFNKTNAMAQQIRTSEGRKLLVSEVARTHTIGTAAKVSRLLAEAIKETSTVTARDLKVLLDGTSSMLVRSGRVGVEGLKGMTAEGVTEAMQEYIAIKAEGNKITPEEMLNRLLNAGFAGGTLGGGMSLVGTAGEGIADAQVIAGLETATRPTDSLVTREIDRTTHSGKKPLSVDEVIEVAEVAPTNTSVKDDTRGQNLDGQGQGEKTEPPKGRLQKILGGLPGLVRGQLKEELDKFQSTQYMSYLGSILGVNTGRGGLGFEDERRRLVAKITGHKAFDGLYTSTQAGYRTTKEFSNKIYSSLPLLEKVFRNIGPKNGNISEELYIEQSKKQIANILTRSEKSFNSKEVQFIQSVWESNYEANDSSSDTASVLNKTVSRHLVHKNENKLAAIMSKKLGISLTEAKRAIILFVQNDQYASPIDVLDLSEANNNKALQQILDANNNETIADTFEMMGASEFLDSNVFNNVVNNGSRVANRLTHQKYLGDNGSKLANLLDLALANGEITPDEKVKIASKLKNYMDQISGDYHRIDSKFYRNAINNLGFLTAISALPLAAISSLVEIGFVLFQNNPKPMKTAFVLAKVGIKEMQATMNEGLAVLTRGKIPMAEYTHREKLRKGGYLLDSQAPAARQGAEVSPRQAAGLGIFFKASGLTGLTNIQRYARLAMAEDSVSHWVSQAITHEPKAGEPSNRFHAEALEQLGNLGGQPDILINAVKQLDENINNPDLNNIEDITAPVLTPAYLDQLENAKLKFVDMAIAMPAIGNRPAFYNDPRYRLFTQFQGYISTATAVLLPIMYDNMGGKERMPVARLNAVKTLASLIAISMFAQAMKDSVKMAFADDEAKDRKDDYLSAWGEFMRGIYGSGALGVLERPIDFVFPLYGDRSSSIGRALDKTGIPFAKGLADTVTSESPSLSYLDNAGKAAYSVATQDNNALRNTVKLTMLQPFGDWLTTYKGE